MNEPLTAVVIEDDPDVSELLTGLLRECGFAVHAAATGADGVQAARMHDPDLITTDLHLPGMNGLEAIRRIREFSDAYVLIVSTSNDQNDVFMGLDAGADDYITQPFRPLILQARVEALQRRPRKSPCSLRPFEAPGTD
ncbi:response regulator transcription factor [Arthrobacter sp. PsM3]|nr:response regulator transcription factor [Arthrobacter sp. PsM3]MDN4645119.1 response regulator transcription factor [Arthrobacter sp. PsM3]